MKAPKNLDTLTFELLSPKMTKGQERKIEIIKSAIKIIATKGIEETSFESIGKPIKMSKTHVAYHFKNKEDIIFKAIEYIINQGQTLTAQKVLKAAPNTQEQIAAIIDSAFEWALKYPDAMGVYLLFFYYSRIHENYRELQEKIRNTGLERLDSILKGNPKLSSEDSAESRQKLAATIQSLIAGSLMYLFTTEKKPSPDSSDKILKICKQQIQNLLSAETNHSH